MPNWCEFDLLIGLGAEGVLLTPPASEELVPVAQAVLDPELDAFLSQIRQDDEGHYLILESLVPMPEEISREPVPVPAPVDEDLLRKYGASDWYSWQRLNWGVKWGDVDTRRVPAPPNLLAFTGMTPWGPPVIGFRTIAARFPRLSFVLRYFEAGMAFQGLLVYHRGELLVNETADYPDGERGG